MDALTLRNVLFFDRIYQALMTSRPPPSTLRPPPSVEPPISRFNTSTVRIHATAQLLFLLQQFLLSKCCEKLWRTIRHIASVAKTKGSPKWEASACFRQRFSPLIGRSIGAEPKIFLWNSLIKPPRVGDVFKGMVAWDFSVCQKAKLGSVFSKSPTVETPKVNRRSSHRFQVGVGS